MDFLLPNLFVKTLYFKVFLNGIASMYIDVYNITVYTIDNGDTHIHVL